MMTDFARHQPSAEEAAQRRELAARMKVAIDAAKLRRNTPYLEAVMTNDGILIADFYGIRPGRQNSRFGSIHAHFEYDEYELAIQHVEAM